MKQLPFLLLFIFNFSLSSIAQKLESPSEFLGYELGTKFSRHHEIINYFKQVAKQRPDQVSLEKYGETNERRPLYLAIISSAENIKNIETIRQNNLKNAGVIDGEASSKDVAIVWLSYNVHGNEASSSEASMKTIYTLLTEKQEWLKNVVVIIDPCMNPDGRDRYVNWYNETASTPYDIDQQASEHSEPWPGGRSNHYLFDLNRDWAWATQVETIARLKVYNQWLPQIHVDFHEQGINDPYYFAPAAEPFHEIISKWQRDFQVQIGKNHAKYFDANGWLYFTKQFFDLLYPSYGDTYPTYMGAIGMTYEQAGNGRAGLGIMNDERNELTLVDRIAHHTITGLSTVEMAAKNTDQLISEFKKFFKDSDFIYDNYVLQGNEDQLDDVRTLLDKHEIKYGNATTGKVSGFNYDSSSKGSSNTTTKDLAVSSHQAKGKMVKVLFEPKAMLADSLTYDITAWSIPYAYGLNAIANTNKSILKPYSTTLPKVNVKAPNAVGYLFKWNHMKDAQFLAELLTEGFKVRYTEKPFSSDTSNVTFGNGSLVVIRGDNQQIENFDDQLIENANKHNRNAIAASSGFAKSGPDFGSPDIKLVGNPKVALLSGNGTSSLNYGEVWHFFEQQLQYPITSLNSDDFSEINLNSYNVLIMPSGSYGKILDDSNLDKLKNWVKQGGKLIAIDGALKSFADKTGFSLKKQKVSDSLKSKKNLLPFAERERESVKDFIIGAVFKTHVDNTHPMAFGYGDEYFTLKLGNKSYQLLDKGYNVAWLGENPKPVSGFAGNDALKNLGNSLIFGEERIGKGSIVYMVDNTLFRSFWENGKLFLVNAVFFVNNNNP